jgi:biopolymer transport protein ExbD
MGKRQVPGLNSSSTADIAFILLIFFLITTSMDTDRGLAVRLPNPPEENQQDPPKIRERNSMVVYVNMNNQIMVTVKKKSQECEISEIREIAKEFIANPNNDPDLPELIPVELPAPFGVQSVTKNHVISFQTDRATNYDTYFQVENELYGAYNELRDDLAKKTFGRPYKECSEDEQLACRQYYKCVISEAEPKKYN